MPADENTIVIPKAAMDEAIKAPPYGGLNPDSTLPQKKRIVPGLVATGGLLAGGILLSSFQTTGSGADEAELSGEAAGKIGAVLSTSHPVSELVADDLSFEEARDLAREEVGPGGLFTYKGVVNVTRTEAEMDLMTPAEKEAFMLEIAVEQNELAGTTIDLDGRLMNMEFPLMDRYMEILTDEDGNAFTRDINGNVNLLDNVTKDPFSNQLIRTDAETGEITQFNPSVILQNVDEGRIDISIYPSDVEITNNGEILYTGGEQAEPLVSAGWMLDDAGDWGFDYDGDGVIDLYEDEIFETTGEETLNTASETETIPMTEKEIQDERMEQIADDAGIDDIRKIKVNETGDGQNIKIKGEDGEKIKMNLDNEGLNENIEPELLNERILQIADEAGIDDIRKIKVNETEDGYDVKIKGDDGEKIKMHLSNEDLDNGYMQDDVGDADISSGSYDDITMDNSNYEELA